MVFTAKICVPEKDELVFFLRQLNDFEISPRLNGREVNIRLVNESLTNICWVMNLYESLPNRSGKNEMSFTITG